MKKSIMVIFLVLLIQTIFPLATLAAGFTKATTAPGKPLSVILIR